MGGLIYSGALNDQNMENLNDSGILNPAYAEDTDNTASKREVNAKSEKNSLISVTAKCSCSLFDDYNLHKVKWLNYCPQCHKYGTLKFTRGGGCPEGMLYCTSCDADFCAVHGKEHVYSGATYLRHA